MWRSACGVPEDHEGAHAGGDGEADVDEHGHQLGGQVRERVLCMGIRGAEGRSVEDGTSTHKW